MSGVCFKIELIPTANSGIEVKIPRTKKETAKDDRPRRSVKRVKELMIIPLQYQITKNDKKYRTTCKTIIFLSYHIYTCGSSTGGASDGSVGVATAGGVVCLGGLASDTTNF